MRAFSWANKGELAVEWVPFARDHSMYVAKAFEAHDQNEVWALVREHPLGTLISHGTTGLQASPLPFLAFPDEGAHGVLHAHMARANPHWQALQEGGEVLVIFQGAQGYITPSWYPGKAAHGKAVPTWNYAMAEARGTLKVIMDAEWLYRQASALTQCHEQKRFAPWAIEDAPASYIDNQIKAIVGLEITLSALQGKWKMSQNRTPEDQAGVAAGLSNEQDPHHHGCLADEVKKYLK